MPRSTKVARRDPEQNRERILEAALVEFARSGLGGARVDRIAGRAGANKRMLYYYFGNKEALFLAVLESRYAHIRRAEQGLRLGALDPAEGVRRLIAFTWNYFLKHPELLTLLNTENLPRARPLRRSRHIAGMHSPLVATLRGLLERGWSVSKPTAGRSTSFVRHPRRILNSPMSSSWISDRLCLHWRVPSARKIAWRFRR